MEDKNVSGNSLRILGKQAEAEFLRHAEARGLAAESHTRKSISHDFVVRGLRVQVKHRISMANGRVDLCFARRAGASRKAYLLGEFDVLAMRCDGKWFLIPASVLDAGNGETLVNNIAPSKYAEYIDNWAILEGGGVSRHPSQMRFNF